MAALSLSRVALHSLVPKRMAFQISGSFSCCGGQRDDKVFRKAARQGGGASKGMARQVKVWQGKARQGKYHSTLCIMAHAGTKRLCALTFAVTNRPTQTAVKLVPANALH